MTEAVDLFAGAGGFTEGAASAGIKVVAAANHWPAAVETHRRNHPRAVHFTQDLAQADFTQFPRHDVLLASPACQGHSKARGKDQPHHDACRSTAWAVVACAEVHRPPFIVVENVPEFIEWRLYPAWAEALKLLGYTLSVNVLNAADFGVPQSRVRVFVVATRSRHELAIRAPGRKHVGAAAVIDFSAGKWSPIARKGRSLKTLQRIEAGRELGRRFIVAYYGSERGGRPLDQPLGTVTTRDRFAVVDGDRMRMLRTPEYRAAMGFRPSYWLPPQHKLALHLLGNAVPPPMAEGVLREVLRCA